MEIAQMGLWNGDGILLQWGTVAAKGFVILCIAAIACLLLRGVTSALRHLCWTLALAAVLLVPLLGIVTPRLDVGILPAWEFSSETAQLSSDAAARPGADAPNPDEPSADAESIDERAAGAAAWNAPTSDASGSADGVGGRTVTDGTSVPSVSSHKAPIPGTRTTLVPGTAASWARGMLVMWLFGAVVLLIRFLAGLVRAERLIRSASAVTEPEWMDLMAEIGDRLDLRRSIRLLRSNDARVPLTWGIRRPAVLIPSTSEAWSAEKRRCVLAHEMAHIRRFDCFTQSIASLACIVHWFNPLAWHAAHHMRLEREKACDAAVPEAARAPASAYAGHLLDIARGIDARFRTPSAVVTMASRSQLEGRVLSILEGGGQPGLRLAPAATVTASATLLLVAITAMNPISPSHARDAEPMRPAQSGDVDVDVSLDAQERVRADVTARLRMEAASDREPAPAAGLDSDPDPAAVSAATPAPATSPPPGDVVKRSFTVSPNGRLDVDTDMGSIRVRTWDRNVVDVEVRRDSRGSGNVLDFELAFNQNGNTVEVNGRGPRGIGGGRDGVSVQYLVTVPRRFNLDLETSGGNIEIDDLQGTADVSTAGGNLSFGRISGSIDARTSGGNVSIDGSDGNVDVSTSGGNIRLGPTGGTVDVKTSGGNISVDEVGGTINAVTSGGQITARIAGQPTGHCLLKSSGGPITVYLAEDIQVDLEAETSAGRVDTDVPVQIEGTIEKNRLRGRINGGGPALVLDTAGGDIRIRRL